MAHMIDIPTFRDTRGSLSVIENQLGFAIKRVFYIYDASSPRGGHAHHKTQLALICLTGSCEISVITAHSHGNYQLHSPEKCLILEPSEWHTMQHFSSNALLLVLASELYDPNDYIFERPQ